MALDTNLISYYKLDSNSNDSVGTNNGTDTAITYSAWKIWDCAWYTWATSKIVITENTSLALTEFSYSFWFQVPNTTGFKPLFRRSAAFTQWVIAYVNWANVYWAIWNGADITTPATAVSASTWYHWVLTWSNTTKTVWLTVNAWTPQTTVTATNITSSWTLNLLYDVPNATAGNAKIDEVGIWSRVLASTEISQLYNSWSWLAYPFPSGNSNFFMFF